MASPSSSCDGSCPVVAEWMKREHLVGRAASKGRFVQIGPEGLTRDTMEINVEILAPIIDQLGSSAGNICMHVD